MIYLRSLLLIFFAALSFYTAAVVLRDGVGLIPVFLAGLLSLTWQGQFNLDFAGYLALSGLWVAWRSGFTGAGITLGVIATFAGMLFFAPLALILMGRSGGDVRKLLLGVHAQA
tara:strand:+ start:920 stop:1261 length:342 start_codon:yes stop_codon:yes gene_type:complete